MRLAHDTVPMLQAAYLGSAPSNSLDATNGQHVQAGGVDFFEEPTEPEVPVDKHCVGLKGNGAPCLGWAGEDGLCNGHRRQDRAGSVTLRGQ